MLVDKGVFVLSLILESQSFDSQVSNTTKLIFGWFTFKRGVCLKNIPIWFDHFSEGRKNVLSFTDCLLLKSIFFQLLIFLLDVTNIKIISHLNVSRQRCFVLSLISESQSFDFQVSKTPKLIFAWSLLKEVCVLETFQFGLFTFLRDRRMSYHSTDCLLLKSIFFQL